MTAFLIYIAKAAVALTLLYSLYGICLRRESFHSLNRLVLILILATSIRLPFLRVESSYSTLFSWLEKPTKTIVVTDVTSVPTISDTTEVVQEGKDMLQSALSAIGVTEILLAIYIIGIAFFALRYLLAIFRTVRTIRQAQAIHVEGINDGHILVSQELDSSCSWLHWILLTPNDVETPSILTHELAHVRLRHSYDKLFCEMVVRLLWFVPFGWMLREDLSDIHEYEADRSVLAAGFDIKEYCLLLIHRATHPNMTSVVNSFNESKIKQRMVRMFQPKSTKRAALKALYLLPLAAVTIVATAEPKQKVESIVVSQNKEGEPLIVLNGKVMDTAAINWPNSTNADIAEAIHINPGEIDHITVLKGATGKDIWGERGANGVIEIETKRVAEDDHQEVFIIAEEPAEFVGGNGALANYISHHFHYPVIARDNKVQGTIQVSFIVEKDGSIIEVEATKLENPVTKAIATIIGYASETDTPLEKSQVALAENTLKASAAVSIRNMPNWKPARQRGIPVRMKMTLFINYRLQ